MSSSVEPYITDLPVIDDEAAQLYIQLADRSCASDHGVSRPSPKAAAADTQPADARPPDAQPPEGQPPEGQPPDAQPAGASNSTRRAWQQLEALGLVDGSMDAPRVLDPAPLVRRARSDLQRKRLQLEEEAERARIELDRIRAAYVRSGSMPASASAELEVVQGHENITAAIDEAFADCRRQLLRALPGGGRTAAALEDVCPRDIDLLRRGIRIRALYQHPARFTAQARLYLEQLEAHGAEVRTLDEFFNQLIVVDRRLAFLPAADNSSVAVAVRQPAVVRFLVDVFDRAWIRAIPFARDAGRAAHREAVDSTRLIVARLVVTGDTDEVCARRAGLSLRNYREHVRQLMAQMGARSRSELGYRIAQARLLENGNGTCVPSGRS
jgi:hypothetical protein